MRAARALLTVLALVACLGALPACGGGGDEADNVAEDLRTRAEELRERARRARDRLVERIREVLADIEKSVPQATPTTRPPQSLGETEPSRIDTFLTKILRDVDAYWTQTLTASGLDEPTVSYVWVPRGEVVRTGCGVPADDQAAFYCPSDDTIYIATKLASDLWEGVADGFPGQRAGYGRAVGDFGLAYVVAHEYAHNLQAELGFFRLRPGGTVKPFELQADCMAGLWGNSVYRRGGIQKGDVEEALGTAAAAGDFDFGNAGHHGTPEERGAAWLLGYRTGEPRVCQQFVPV